MPPIDSKKDKVELVSGGKRVNGQFIPNDPNESLTSSSLAPQQDFNLDTNIAPSTAGVGLRTEITQESDQFVTGLTERRQRAEETMKSSQSDLVEFARSSLTPTEASVQAEGAQGVPQLEDELIDINNQIRAKEAALTREIERMEKNPRGLFGGALEDEIRRVEREGTREIADLSIIALARQGKYDAAKARADRAVTAYLEDQRQEQEIRMFTFEQHKDLFDDAEQREFLTLQSDRDRKLNNIEADEKALSSAKIEAIRMAQLNSASSEILSAIQSARTPEEVFQVAGKYGSVDLLDRAIKAEQLAKLREEPDILIPTDVIDQGGKKLLINTQTGEVIKDFGKSDIGLEELRLAVEEQKIQQVDDLMSHGGLNSSVGPFKGTRIALIDQFGAKDDFIASVDQLTKEMTLDNLIKAKEEGATFGALSEGELKLLSDSASRINSWRVEDDGRTEHFDASQKDFIEELATISFYMKLDAFKRGSSPESLGGVTAEDGSVWLDNGKGEMVRVK